MSTGSTRSEAVHHFARQGVSRSLPFTAPAPFAPLGAKGSWLQAEKMASAHTAVPMTIGGSADCARG